MKKVILLVCILTIALPATAQERETKSRKEVKKNHLKDLSPEQRAELKTKHMALALDLSDKQQREILELNTAVARDRQKKMESRKAIKESGKTLTSDEKFKMKSEQLDRQLEVQKKLKSILTQEQYDQWKKMKSRNQKRKHVRKKHPRQKTRS